ncbi:histone-lysine N-methyltransferase SETMAR [Elysia marginata]|uniref:Histone-lysine N-methyltransferase SETMAR n=1 Tax=Elysia marginata TaxID=1093978 RepID=A0AAV4IMR8_9GAST|nr:histone-lysine N-methyltransferase SETMAR [Elysia marginata]
MSRSRVHQKCTWFGENRTSVDDEPKSARPKTSTDKENTSRVDELIKCDWRMKIYEIALKLETPKKTKRDSMTWKHPSSPETKKFKVQRSTAEVMATVFWGAKGVILINILPQRQCINASQYCSTLDRLRQRCNSLQKT